MRRAIAMLLLLVFCVPAVARGDERSEEHEREEREKKDAKLPKGEARAGDDVLLYALGALLGGRVRSFSFNKKELETVKRGFADSAGGKKLKLPDADMDEWGPRVDAMLARRNNPVVTAEKERGAAFASAAAKEDGAAKLPSGVVVKTLREGTGAGPSATDVVRVRYQGKLTDGTVFDSSSAHGDAPAEFRLDKVVSCWTEGVQRMKPGGKARLVCPSQTAYGNQGRPPQIPGGATVVFEVELVDVKR